MFIDRIFSHVNIEVVEHTLAIKPHFISASGRSRAAAHER
jgi:hypothetical protein